ncbi:hypothetical protein BKA67DRAFT_662382 [Truncatella angustata]|uniref:HECT-type E3 ubiquitin transferase n=1 Tax=Truncatella angustata TaxID=152316 RepID=A0A9P8RQK9_9PEZI|nr:uncharacterized protein BKA67DRAFT_662382 [Truncatella angustata]KAH6647608.1 hypothetical protein BKA67DRAFT_662382 [Truncatella angustata]
MSPRRTRSSARYAASQAASPAGPSSGVPSGNPSPTASSAQATTTTTTTTPRSTATQGPSRKRKSRNSETSPSQPTQPEQPASSTRRPKRQKVQELATPAAQPQPQPAATRASTRKKKEKTATDMSSPEDSPLSPALQDKTPSGSASASSSRKSSRNKRGNQSAQESASTSASGRRSKKVSNTQASPSQDVSMTGTDENERDSEPPAPPPPAHDPDDDSDDHDEDDDEEDDDDEQHRNYDDDPFGGFRSQGGSSISETLRALTGMMSGMGSRLRGILDNLRMKEEPSMQMIALSDLSEILLMANEDNLAGHFSPDAFVKELVALMQPNEFTGEENPDMMLLACRCLANLMEALPASAANVVYGGAVPVLCAKLLEIQYIDLAEQSLSTLEKISVDYPTSIVREGGLTACLSYLDFFATSTQRTAVTTAANCCRNIPEDSFPVIKDVMPILLNVLGSSDQRVVEQASLCVTRIIESFKYQSSKLEELVSVDLLRAILRLLVPGTTNLISANIHTQFLRVLAITARASPRLSAELFKLNVVETLYQILTGVSPPDETEDVASKLDSVVIMQALIHRPREQIIETLNVVCELLPGLKWNELSGSGLPSGHDVAEPTTPSSVGGSRKKSSSEKRLELLEGCKDQVRRFALILFPTLTDAFSSTVNLNVRQKVLTAQLKMLSNLDKDILVDALKSVPYASFLAAILSQQDHPSLVLSAIQTTELLLARLDDIYRYQIYREGVITEISKLAESQDSAPKTTETPQTSPDPALDSVDGEGDRVEIHNDSGDEDDAGDGDGEGDHEEDHEADHDDEENDDEDEEDDDDNDENEHNDDISGSPVSSDGSTMSIDGPPRLFVADIPSMKSRISEVAKKFLEAHETEKHGKTMKKKATKILSDLQALAADIEAFYLHRTAKNLGPKEGVALFETLASYFDADVLENVTSAELMASGLVRVLEEVFSNPDEALANTARAAFLEVFMGRSVKSKPRIASADSPATPFSIMAHKLQDLLSRSEHFEVLTVHQNTFDGNRSSAASMLAKQIRLKLVADESSDIPREYRGIMVSIHAIATFKALDDYLRPRISLHERPRRGPRDFARALAEMTGVPPGRLMDRAGYSSTPVPPPPVPPQASSSRPARKSKAQGMTEAETPATPNQGSLRRSTRRNPAASAESPARPPPPDDDDDLQNALECADEKPMSDDDDDIPDSSALEALIGDLDDDMEDDDDEPRPDPSAVNLEVATSGKVTARKEDGTRVLTPAQSGGPGNPPSRNTMQAAPATAQATPTPAAPSSRPFSYAAAVQSVPQDWHIEFSLDGKVIPNETTIYRAVHSASANADEHLTRSIWSAVHSIKFRRVPGPPPTESIGFNGASDAAVSADGAPASLAKHPTTGSILRLLKILHDLNANLDDIVVENKDALKLNREPLSQFVNTKLTAKLNRQLEEPLIVASNCLPGWSEDLARLYPFIFPFETRHLFLQSTSFGYARSMTRWQNAQQEDTNRRDRRDERPFLGRLQRQKVRISRSKILESALKVMELYGESRSILEVEYFEEVGTGLGPTLEFYSNVSKEFSKKKLKLWREVDSNDSDEFISGPHGLFPRPLAADNAANVERVLFLFKMLGKFVARSMIDSRIIDLNFNPIFFRVGDEGPAVKPSLGAAKVVDRGLANSLKHIKKFATAKQAIDEDPNRTPAQKVADTDQLVVDGITIEDLALDFTLPGFPDVELVSGGAHTPVTIYNVESYLDKVIDMTLGSGVKRQIDAFRAGFSQVFPYTALSAFTPNELVSLFGRIEEDWTLETLMDSIKADHGFNMDSRSVKNLLQTMSEMTPGQRRDFLQFTTGSPKLPIGGFKSLTPMFTVVCKPSEPPYTADDYLPSVMTCVNYLKLPDYTSIEKMRKQLFTAIREGQGAFHLS